MPPALAELAAGAMAGQERARALEHVAGCRPCRRELNELTQAADALLLLAAPAEPPAGFESGVLARLERRPRRHPRQRLLAAAAALILAGGASGATVWWRTAADRDMAAQYRPTLTAANGRYIKAARLSNDAGTVLLYQGTPSWLLATVTDAADGQCTAVVVDRAGAEAVAGGCAVVGRAGTAGYRIDLPVTSVQRVELRGANGTRLAAAF